MSTRVGLFYANIFGNHFYYTFIFTVFVLFLMFSDHTGQVLLSNRYNFQADLSDQYMGRYQVLTQRAKVDLGVMAKNGYLTLHRSPEL